MCIVGRQMYSHTWLNHFKCIWIEQRRQHSPKKKKKKTLYSLKKNYHLLLNCSISLCISFSASVFSPLCLIITPLNSPSLITFMISGSRNTPLRRFPPASYHGCSGHVFWLSGNRLGWVYKVNKLNVDVRPYYRSISHTHITGEQVRGGEWKVANFLRSKTCYDAPSLPCAATSCCKQLPMYNLAMFVAEQLL